MDISVTLSCNIPSVPHIMSSCNAEIIANIITTTFMIIKLSYIIINYYLTTMFTFILSSIPLVAEEGGRGVYAS